VVTIQFVLALLPSLQSQNLIARIIDHNHNKVYLFLGIIFASGNRMTKTVQVIIRELDLQVTIRELDRMRARF
jgi:hypothetical protein